MFTINSEDNIAAHAEIPAGSDNLQSFDVRDGTGEASQRVARHPAD